MTQPKILPLADRVQIIFSTVEEAMTKLSRIGTRPALVPLTDAAIEKRQREVREELRREIERLVRGRGRDVLGLVRQYVEENEETAYDRQGDPVMVVYPNELLSVIDAGFIAEDEPVAGERCPLCERGMTEHSKIDLYGTDAFICAGATRDGVIINVTHPQALHRLHDAATREAQRQFDELTKGSEARRKAEDYAAILDVLAEVPAEQLEGLEWEEGSMEFAPVVQQLLTRGPVLERERLEAVIRDTLRGALDTLDANVNDAVAVDMTAEFVEQAAGLLANILKAIFPVRVEYVSMEESDRVELARREPPPPLPLLTSDAQRGLIMPAMREGQTHWLIGNDYGLFYKMDAAGNVTRIENEYTPSFAPEDIQPGDAYTAEPSAGDGLIATIASVSHEPAVTVGAEGIPAERKDV